jgi:hypothetical protein
MKTWTEKQQNENSLNKNRAYSRSLIQASTKKDAPQHPFFQLILPSVFHNRQFPVRQL